jgi:hypothetical protein
VSEQPIPERDVPDYLWATVSEPDALVLQLAVLPVVTESGPVDVMRTLLERRGFRPVVAADELDLQPSRGCVLTRSADAGPALLVTVGSRVGASRFALEGVDEAWWSRAVSAGHAAVLAVETAVHAGADAAGTTSRESLRLDAEAGGVLAALVPVEDLRTTDGG